MSSHKLSWKQQTSITKWLMDLHSPACRWADSVFISEFNPMPTANNSNIFKHSNCIYTFDDSPFQWKYRLFIFWKCYHFSHRFIYDAQKGLRLSRPPAGPSR